MNTRRFVAGISAAALTAAGAFVLATAGTAGADEITTFDEARDELVGQVDPAVVETMTQHFGLSEDAVYDRLAVEAV
ncbi:MAG: hypothetical protein ACRDXX_19850, partial [Stackebrandtia sp.]